MKYRSVLLAIVQMFLIINISSNDCEEKRHLIEFGSGTTKLSSFLFNKCNNSIISELLKANTAIPFHKCVLESPERIFSQACTLSTIKMINKFLHKIKVFCKVERCFGYATAWAREMTNSEKALESLTKGTEIPIAVVTQELEAYSNYDQGIVTLKKENRYDESKLHVLLDLGGGSFQLLTTDRNGRILFKGGFGTVSLTRMFEEKGFLEKNEQMMKCNLLPKASQFLDQLLLPLLNSPLYKYLQGIKDKVLFSTGIATSGISEEMELGYDIALRDITSLINKTCDQSFDFFVANYPKRQRIYMEVTPAYLLMYQRIITLMGFERFYSVPAALTTDYYATNIESMFPMLFSRKDDL